MGLTPAAVVLAALASPRDPELDLALGVAGATAVRTEMAARARRWAADVAPDRAFEATTFGAAAVALHDHDGPVLLAAPDVPGLSARAAEQALDDLAAGVAVCVGPTNDGRPFLLALARLDLVERVDGAGFEEIVALAEAEDAPVGMLRSERRLVSAADARALSADPVAPAALRALCGVQGP